MDVNTFNDAHLFEMDGWQDVISSFQLGEGVRMKLCMNNHCEGENQWYNAIEMVGPYNSGVINEVEDRASHIYLYHYDPKTEKYVKMFSYPRFEGSFMGIFGVGHYTSNDILNHHLDWPGNPLAVSSFVVPEGVYLRMYRENDYVGETFTV